MANYSPSQFRKKGVADAVSLSALAPALARSSKGFSAKLKVASRLHPTPLND